jgi:CRP/FNR family transcriptional regulator, cyclic AMP receptor protein
MPPAKSQTTAALRSASFLGGLPEPQLQKLAERAHVVNYAKGETIYQRGDDGDTMMEIAVLDGRERTAGAVALEATEALVIYRRDLLPALMAAPATMIEVISILCDKLRAASQIIEDSSLQMQGRTASGLLRLAAQHGRQTSSGVVIDLKLSQRDLGSYVGLSRENVSRQLKELREAGLVVVEDQILIIPDLDALKQRAESGES